MRLSLSLVGAVTAAVTQKRQRSRAVVPLLAANSPSVARCSAARSWWRARRTPASASAATSGVINAIGAENEYANVLSQIGGKYVAVSSILNNPNTDPHTFESSPSVAEEVSARRADRAERRRATTAS